MTQTKPSPQAEARALLRQGGRAALATLDETGAPFTSLVLYASAIEGAPLLMLSDLAVHCKNLARDKRVSLLIEQADAADPMAAPRLSVTGVLHQSDIPSLQDRFVRRHAQAESWAGFGDFHLYRLRVTGLHLVAGFGRIHTLDPADVLYAPDQADPCGRAAMEIVAHMNKDHGDALNLYATVLLGRRRGNWHALDIDPDGLDMIETTREERARLPLDPPVFSADAARVRLVGLVKQAREA